MGPKVYILPGGLLEHTIISSDVIATPTDLPDLPNDIILKIVNDADNDAIMYMVI